MVDKGAAEEGAVDERAEVCVLNIGPGQRQRRMRLGIACGAIGLALAVALVLAGMDRCVRLAVFAPFAISAYGFFQAKDRV